MLYKGTLFVILIFVSQTCPVFSEELAPLELAQEIFSRDTHINILDYVTGEYTGDPNGKDLNENSQLRFILLMQDEDSAVVAMEIYDDGGYGIDYYLFFTKETVWRMYAIRSLWMPRFFEEIVNELGQMADEEIENMINANNEYSIFSTMDEYNFMLGNGRLILETDDNIIAHFNEHMEEFERLKDSAVKELDGLFPDGNIEGQVNLITDLESDYRKLYISSISIGDIDFGLSINFLLGGILDNSDGYIYTSDKINLPKMSPNGVIMIREIGNGWYMYKTT